METTVKTERTHPALAALTRHWPEYLIEGALLGIFMVSACAFGVLLEHPASPVRQALGDADLRRVLGGIAMGATAVALIYSPWGRRSGAHFNPAVTATFLRLGKIEPWDAFFYVVAQFAGGVLGVVLSRIALGMAVADPTVQYAVTVPGAGGTAVAFFAELGISFGIMLVILMVSNAKRVARFTGVFAGLLVATYIALEAPLSGMSMNPARTVASAVPASQYDGLWIYFAAPILGMLLAAELYRAIRGLPGVLCAKLHHDNQHRCIFRCAWEGCGSQKAS
jgi:aquaporin Z